MRKYGEYILFLLSIPSLAYAGETIHIDIDQSKQEGFVYQLSEYQTEKGCRRVDVKVPYNHPEQEKGFASEIKSRFSLYNKKHKELLTNGVVEFAYNKQDGKEHHIGSVCLPQSKKIEYDLYVSWVKAKEIKCEGPGDERICSISYLHRLCPHNFNVRSLNKIIGSLKKDSSKLASADSSTNK